MTSVRDVSFDTPSPLRDGGLPYAARNRFSTVHHRDLTKSHGAVLALEGVGFELPLSEVHAFEGADRAPRLRA